MSEKTVAVIAFDDVSPFLLSVPCTVFGETCMLLGIRDFKLIVCAAGRKPLHCNVGFSIRTVHGLQEAEKADIVVVPSWRNTDEVPPDPLLKMLRRAHRRGALIVGLCLGTFVIAAAGLLDNRPATTHWGWTDDLARRYPLVDVKSDVLYVDDGDVITSAGVAAGIDCCLHIV